ncbi:MAG: response regulator transcription factor [Lachnospiraceae bacterium]|nr:response regulator transcription factor [Lachnospiraceae bacterium]
MFRILIADDDKNIRRLLSAVLKNAGYTTVTAENGAEALKVLDSEEIDLAVVDVMMPVMDGYELTQALRAAREDLPILMVSARQLPEDRKKGFLSGTDDYITKPVDEEELVLRIRALLRRARIASEHRLTVGRLTLDYDALTVSDGEEVFTLPQKEFMLLFRLLSNPGRIFTRIQLMDEIWGSDSETGWETVTVHIGRLRKRFEKYDDFDIVAVRGLGYKAVRK